MEGFAKTKRRFRGFFFTSLALSFVGFFVPRAVAFQSHHLLAEHAPESTPLTLELDRAILILEQGQKEHWETRDHYLKAFEKTASVDSQGRLVTDAKRRVECAIGAHLRAHQPWDEGAPIGVEVQNAMADFRKLRQGSAVELPVSLCAIPTPRRVKVSAGVAASLLKHRVDPVYPLMGHGVHVFGTVVLQATISRKGVPDSLRVIGGPVFLGQSALEAVRQWVYRPYLLNGEATEFETTVHVVFAQPR